jgi:hypothetical protein
VSVRYMSECCCLDSIRIDMCPILYALCDVDIAADWFACLLLSSCISVVHQLHGKVGKIQSILFFLRKAKQLP